MKIDAINSNLSEVNHAHQSGNFGQFLSQSLQKVNQDLIDSEQGVQLLAAGKTDNLHHLMLQLEQAKLSIELVAQIRSRALSAYQDMMKQNI